MGVFSGMGAPVHPLLVTLDSNFHVAFLHTQTDFVVSWYTFLVKRGFPVLRQVQCDHPAILMTSYRPVQTSRTTNTRTFMGSCKAFAPAIVGMSCQIHADFLRLLWVLADEQMRSYYESMGKEDKIGTEAFR